MAFKQYATEDLQGMTIAQLQFVADEVHAELDSIQERKQQAISKILFLQNKIEDEGTS